MDALELRRVYSDHTYWLGAVVVVKAHVRNRREVEWEGETYKKLSLPRPRLVGLLLH